MTPWMVLVLFFVTERSGEAVTSGNVLWSVKRNFIPDFQATGDQMAMTSVTATSGACAALCTVGDWCNSFSFAPGNGTCDLYSLQFINNGSAAVPSGDVKYYTPCKDECPQSENFIWDRRSDLCFLVVTQPAVGNSWLEANSSCAARGLALVSLNTVHKLDAVVRTLRNNPTLQGVDYYIGASRPLSRWNTAFPASGQDYRWVNGDPVDTVSARSYWAIGNPDNNFEQENVLLLNRLRDFSIHDRTATSDSPAAYICEKVIN
ncbi:hypothetical protein BaRGS_00034976 [Batillaria attramentaria]|uniref:C-type lectin domain-containing protein n=1 Tax=Batillaria attramentaria TaxID=370345 RepID=A0ABD0JG21_9CAEN